MPRPCSPRRAVALAALALLAGCATTAAPPQPAVPVPEAWGEPAASGRGEVPLDWWRAFGAEELAALVAEAIAGSPDLAVAGERVRQAEAQVRVAGASLFPTLDLGIGSVRRDTRPDAGPAIQVDTTNASISASYEVDLWGRLASGARAAEASLAASRYDLEGARLTLVAGVATGYFDLLSLRGRIVLARENVATAERVLALVEARVRNGAASPLDLVRQRAATAAQRAAIPTLELQERQTLAALAILVGRPPAAFAVQADSVEGLALPAVAPGLPAELLVRRPDLAAAEAQLLAANADLAAARAALLPSVTLNASAGLASGALLAFGNAATITTAAAALAQPIFDAGRRSAQVDAAAARERELVETYRRAILAALADVENALAATGRNAQAEALQREVRTQAAEALRLAEIRYRAGADDLLVVLDAQRTLFQAQDQLAQARRARLQTAVSTYRALGGGWTLPAAAPRVGAR
ncbi:MAG: efflux transporter outer membrane subunit [Burkholderiales bacterium]|nr:efflux transporter outer membrane subunit [Burkholderiales bacterium]